MIETHDKNKVSIWRNFITSLGTLLTVKTYQQPAEQLSDNTALDFYQKYEAQLKIFFDRGLEKLSRGETFFSASESNKPKLALEKSSDIPHHLIGLFLLQLNSYLVEIFVKNSITVQENQTKDNFEPELLFMLNKFFKVVNLEKRYENQSELPTIGAELEMPANLFDKKLFDDVSIYISLYVLFGAIKLNIHTDKNNKETASPSFYSPEAMVSYLTSY